MKIQGKNIIQFNFIFISLTGLAFCMASLFGKTSHLCFTNGCLLYKNFSFLGFSFYTWGLVVFGLIFLLSLQKKKKILNHFIFFILICDIFLLIFQVFYAPCFNCLIVAIFIGYLANLCYRLFATNAKKNLLIFFAFLIAVNGISIIKEKIPPEPIYGDLDAPVKIFFSPTCPGCKEMIRSVLLGCEIKEKFALYPVCKNKSDFNKIHTLKKYLNDDMGLNKAMEKVLDEECSQSVPFNDYLKLKWLTYKNKFALIKSGIPTIPIMICSIPPIINRLETENKANIEEDNFNTNSNDFFPNQKNKEAGCFYGDENCE